MDVLIQYPTSVKVLLGKGLLNLLSGNLEDFRGSECSSDCVSHASMKFSICSKLSYVSAKMIAALVRCKGGPSCAS